MCIVLWKRLGSAGHDACRYRETGDGWAIEGSAVFEHDGDVAALNYELSCDKRWASRKAFVKGRVGENEIELLIERAHDGSWRVDGITDPALDGLEDIDLGFTPASNMNAIRRLGLRVGGAGQSEAVWLDTDGWTIKPLRQTYRRVGRNAYEYESPMHGYRATLVVDDFGMVLEYPRLWTMVRKTL